MIYQLNSNSRLLSQMEAADWFSSVGGPLNDRRYHVVKSWEDGFRMIEHDVCRWCTIEARNALYKQMSAKQDSRFRSWNDIARGLARPVCEIVVRATCGTGIPDFPDSAKEWLQAILIGAFMEEEFQDDIAVDLFRQLTDLLCAGRFPCGWYCRAAEDFPEKSPMMVF
jgi:hypothetical protein